MHMHAISYPSRAQLAVAGLSAALAPGGWTVTAQRAADKATPRTVTARGPLLFDEQSTVDLFEKARASVVYIGTQERVMDAWTRNVFCVPRGTGSEFVWDSNGHIITHRHVVAGERAAARAFSAGAAASERPVEHSGRGRS
jgi:S1-C subfamily serine protease